MTMRNPRSRRLLIAGAAAGALISGALAVPAPAGAAAPHWHITAAAAPANLPPGGEGQIVITVSNLGDGVAEATSAPVTVTDRLPAGLAATSVSTRTQSSQGGTGSMTCSLSPQPTCSLAEPLGPYSVMLLTITVKVQEPPGAELALANEVLVEGGEAPRAVSRQPLSVKAAPVAFGIEKLELVPENEDGSVDTQAGSHPFQLTTTLALDMTLEPRPEQPSVPRPAQLPRDLQVDLPAGLIGNPAAVPACTMSEFTSIVEFTNRCPADSAVGAALVTLSGVNNRSPGGRPYIEPVPLFNLAPASGEPARLGFLAGYIPIVLDTSVRTGGDYGITVRSANILQTAGLISSVLSVWGTPGDSRHDAARGWACLDPLLHAGATCMPDGLSEPVPFLTLPTRCEGPLQARAEADSWAAPGRAPESAPPAAYTLHDGTGRSLGLEGCDRLPFDPSLSVQPQTRAASTPTGLDVRLHVPQQPTLSSSDLAEADVRDTTVALPEGMQISPSSANGLEACSEPQVGFIGEGGRAFSPTLPEPFCADASKVGTVHIRTPLLPDELQGGVYLAAQDANPFGSLLALYIVAHDPVSGVLVKLAGEVKLDQRSGRILASFDDTPQLPFEDLKLEFFGGARGPVATPAMCGTYETSAALTPWSGSPPVRSSSRFPITSAAGGSACTNPEPFSPSLSAGSANLQAGAFTPFTMTISRQDGSQNLAGVTLHLPAGLLGMLSSLMPCPEPQASEGACGPASRIGDAVVSAGLGPDPYTIAGGKVFLTGPYDGAPYGLSVVVPAKAGPFDLGQEVVRAAIHIDPHTAALTAVSDPLPQMKDGIPFQLKRIDVRIDRPNFLFNPTSCQRRTLTATILGISPNGSPGPSVAVSTPFALAGCSGLQFRPRFTVLTRGHTSKASGASLHVKVTSGPGQANIAKVRVELPKQLPSRLTTLQKACPADTFDANPASCPAGSVVGSATALTPALKSPLTGPAYLVSHAAAAFPDLVVVLQGEGITLDLIGNTQIKKGITTSTFNAVPDAPFSTFDLVLPQGPHSALGADIPASAKGSLCRQRLVMPTSITGQNGAVVRQTTKVAVSGCPRHRARR
jgi:uncharacterized repeat protein (TIGR01451 family)